MATAFKTEAYGLADEVERILTEEGFDPIRRDVYTDVIELHPGNYDLAMYRIRPTLSRHGFDVTLNGASSLVVSQPTCDRCRARTDQRPRCAECDIRICEHCWRHHRCGRSDADCRC